MNTTTITRPATMGPTMRVIRAIAVAATAAATVLFGTGVAHAAAPGALYSYRLDGTSATVANQGSKTGVNLNLKGTWSPLNGQVHFAGSTTSGMSVGYAKPATGATLSVNSATSGVG